MLAVEMHFHGKISILHTFNIMAVDDLAADDAKSHGPLARYVKLRVAHAPGMPGKISPAAEFEGNRG